MKFERMPIEIESPEEYGYDKINTSDSDRSHLVVPNIDEVEAAIKSNTRLVSVTCPHNPTGSTLSREALDRLVAITKKKGVLLLVDETYRDIAFAEKLPVAASMGDHVLSVCSLSKSFGMPGVRIGWLITTNKTLQETFLAAKEQISISGSVINEWIAIDVLSRREKILSDTTHEMRARLQMVESWIESEELLEWVKPTGGVVCFPRIKQEPKGGFSAFYERLLNKHATYVGPGHWFEMSDSLFRLANYWWAAALAIIAWYIVSSVISWYRLRHIPGPLLAKFSYLWLARLALSGKQYETHLELNKKYGPIVRVGPYEVLTDDLELLRKVNGTKSLYAKGASYSGSRLNPWHESLFMMRDPIAHDKMKAKLIYGYSGKETMGPEAAIDEQIMNLVRLIQDKYISKPREFRPLLWSKTAGLFTLDVISRLALGQEFGCLNRDEDIYCFFDTLRDYLPIVSLTTDVPWLRNIAFSPLFLRLFGPSIKDKKGIGKMMGLTNKVVEEFYHSDGEVRRDMLSSFKKHGLTKDQCEIESIFMFVAGSDTTASVIRAGMLHILATPHVYCRLKREIANTIREGRASKPISNADSLFQPYIQAIVYECLRIRSVSTNMSFKEVPTGGDVYNGKFLPAGTNIGMNFSGLLRSETLFGKDAHIFRPERFTEVDDKTSAKLKRDVELTFGLGRWSCLGKPIALMELNKIFFELFRHFDFQLAEPHKAMQFDSYMLFRDKGLVLRVTESDLKDLKSIKEDIY
ncbi:pisatin demethylase [Fusarium oxysporum]|nr:pisatin demethylase [Fusarium oxysporum]